MDEPGTIELRRQKASMNVTTPHDCLREIESQSNQKAFLYAPLQMIGNTYKILKKGKTIWGKTIKVKII
jgi:hypothetical protein